MVELEVARNDVNEGRRVVLVRSGSGAGPGARSALQAAAVDATDCRLDVPACEPVDPRRVPALRDAA